MHLQQVYQAQLDRRKQQSSETLQEFESNIVRLVQVAYSSTSSDFLKHLTTQTFIKGVRNLEIQQALRLVKHKSLKETLAYALEYDAIKQATKGNYIHVKRAEVVFPKENGDAVIKDALMKCFKEVGGDMNKKCFPGQPKCSNCGKVGHLRVNCTILQQSTAGQETENLLILRSANWLLAAKPQVLK